MRYGRISKVLISAFSLIILGACSSVSTDENGNYVDIAKLHHVIDKLYDIKLVIPNNINLTVSDDRPFYDNSSDDSSAYFIDANQEDTKETRLKTVGLMLVDFEYASNIVIPYNITDVVGNYLVKSYQSQRKDFAEKQVTLLSKIKEFWISPSGSATALFFSSFLPVSKHDIVDQIGYRYAIEFTISADGHTKEFKCVNSNYEGAWSFTEEKIQTTYDSMMADINKCTINNM